MEQIYYTQCPMGYGLGASNGFQVKRIGAGYPTSGDVRHLALRAFLPGSNGKALAPGALRYRRLGPVAEVAWLEPRAREYETERGQWGRPGGHFAHGLRLDPEELDALSHWPAGLFGRPFWRRSDPEPSRGRRPDPIDVGSDDLIAPPDFEHVAPTIDLDPGTVARLLGAVAEAARSGRTLFLIDEPDRLGPRIAALTFAFPEILRAELTFSTYHDRPEELGGFRIHGTVPAPTLNRAALAGLGPIADLTSGRFEPDSPPPPWAMTLADWLTRREPRDAEDWTRTNSYARSARRPDDPSTLWSDSWLDGLIGMAHAVRSSTSTIDSPTDWPRFARQAAWSSASGLAGELVKSRGPEWWRPILRDAVRDRSAHEAFWSLVLAPETWLEQSSQDAAAWGVLAAPFWMRYRSPQREQTLNVALRRVSPADSLARFIDGLIRSVPIESGQSALQWLERREEVDPSVLLPLRARVAVGLLRSPGRPDALESVLELASRMRNSLPTVLDLIADEAGAGEDAVPVAEAVCRVMERAAPDPRFRFERWALQRGNLEGVHWLSPMLRRLFATELDRPQWDALRDRTPPELRPALAEVCLDVARSRDMAPESYPWAVEDLLLLISEADRPHSTSWVESYLQRIGSPFELAVRLRERGTGLRTWLASGRADGMLSPGAIALIDDAGALGLLLEGQSVMPSDATLSRLPEEDRAEVLGLLIDRIASGQFDESRPILARCASCWPGAFDVGAGGLEPLAEPLAGLLLQFLPEPDLWIDSLSKLRNWLGIDQGADPTWPPDGIAPAIVTETCRRSADPQAAWDLRSTLLRDDRAYRSLCQDVGRDLRAHPERSAVEVARHWDRALDKGTHADRFFEILLNACDGPRLAEIVPEFAGDLRTIGAIPWWSADRLEEGPSDLRVGFALIVPMAPLASPRCLNPVEAWLLGRSFSTVRDDPEEIPVLDEDQSPADSPKPNAGTTLPDRAIDRWACIRALTEFHWEGKTSAMRWSDLARWRKPGDAGNSPPLSSLERSDRYDFLSWLVLALDHPGSDSYEIESMARWAVKELGLHSRSRLSSSLERITRQRRPRILDWQRLARDLSHQMALQRDE